MSYATAEKIVIEPREKLLPGSFGRRLVAVILDQVILTVVILPISLLLGIGLGFMGEVDPKITNALGNVVSIIAAYYYYGYFYSNRGATPGKMLMNLRVIHTGTGKNLTYNQAVGRELFGKLLSILPLFLGYFIPLFRQDRKALHDLVCNTQVLQTQKD